MEIRNVSYSYGNNQALDQVNLHMGKSDFFAIFGEDDAGKTTLFHVIMGFITDYQGEIAWDDDMSQKPMIQRNIRFLPDDIIREKDLTVRQYFNFAQSAAARYDVEYQNELCQEFDIPMETQLLDLTYRENKMVQIIAALCVRPDLLILDEPVNFLDSQSYKRVLDLLKQQNQDGMGVLIAVEKYEDIKGYCSRYAYLKEGRILACDEAPVYDIRKKVITVTGGIKEQLEPFMEETVLRRGDVDIYLYSGEMTKLPAILGKARCQDFLVESMTLEEELEMDFSRWE